MIRNFTLFLVHCLTVLVLLASTTFEVKYAIESFDYIRSNPFWAIVMLAFGTLMWLAAIDAAAYLYSKWRARDEI